MRRWKTTVTYLMPAIGHVQWVGEIEAETVEKASEEAVRAAGLSNWVPEEIDNVRVGSLNK